MTSIIRSSHDLKSHDHVLWPQANKNLPLRRRKHCPMSNLPLAESCKTCVPDCGEVRSSEEPTPPVTSNHDAGKGDMALILGHPAGVPPTPADVHVPALRVLCPSLSIFPVAPLPSPCLSEHYCDVPRYISERESAMPRHDVKLGMFEISLRMTRAQASTVRR